MIPLRLLSLATAITLLTSGVLSAEPNTLTGNEKSEGWKLLFDGKSTNGWVAIGKTEFPDKGWSVVDGTLFHAKAGGGGDIVTPDKYENFDLKWDWKIGFAANSGVKFNLPDAAKNIGFEYQLLDDDNEPDGKRGGRMHQTASLYDLIEPPADKKLNPIGEWNSSRLIVKGNHVEEWLNGEKTVEFEIGSDDMKDRIARSKYKNIPHFGEKIASPILLQDHGGEIAFRNIKLRVLDAK